MYLQPVEREVYNASMLTAVIYQWLSLTSALQDVTGSEKENVRQIM